MQKENKKQVIEISLDNGLVTISRNYEKNFVIKNGKHKEILALVDAIMNPSKYTIRVHDLRTEEVYSNLTGFVE